MTQQRNGFIYRTEIDSQTQRKNLWSPEGEGIVREFGIDMFKLLNLNWIMNKDLLCSTGTSTQCHVAAWMGGEFEGEWIHVYAWLKSLCCALETVTTLLTSYIRQYKMKRSFFKKEEE